MFWRWLKRKRPELPTIPPSPHWDIKPVERKEDDGIKVEEIDMSATGIFRIFGRRPKEPK